MNQMEICLNFTPVPSNFLDSTHMKSSQVIVLFIGLMSRSILMKGNFKVRSGSTKGTIPNTNALEIIFR